MSTNATRVYFVEPVIRAWKVRESVTTIFADGKDSLAIEDFKLDWIDAIGSDVIASSQWVVPAGLQAGPMPFDATSATIRLIGGTPGNAYTVTNKVTLASGQVKVQDIYIPVE